MNKNEPKVEPEQEQTKPKLYRFRATLSQSQFYPEAESISKKGVKYTRKAFWSIVARIKNLDNRPLTLCTKNPELAKKLNQHSEVMIEAKLKQHPKDMEPFSFVWNFQVLQYFEQLEVEDI